MIEIDHHRVQSLESKVQRLKSEVGEESQVKPEPGRADRSRRSPPRAAEGCRSQRRERPNAKHAEYTESQSGAFLFRVFRVFRGSSLLPTRAAAWLALAGILG
jgi:hypothetical protein